jgi:amidase
VLAYPTMRRKPTLIGEAQLGSSCQLSAATGLPAISMPAGFSTDGVPIGVELLGPAFAEGPLLRLAYGWEQTTHPRVAPFSTPPLVNGAAPSPVRIEAVIKGALPAFARVMFNYDKTTGALRFDASTSGLTDDRVIALTLQRTDGEKPGPIVAHLLMPGQMSGHGTLTLRGRSREDFVAGKMYVHFYTQRAPLGIGRTRVTLP